MRKQFIPRHQMCVMPGLMSIQKIIRSRMRNLKSDWVKRMSNRLKQARQLVRTQPIQRIMLDLPPFLNWTFRLWRWVPLKAANILRCNKSRVIPKRQFRTMRPIDNMRRRNSLDIDEIQPNPASADPIRLSTIETASQRFIAFQMSFSAGKATCPCTLRLRLSDLGGFLAVCARAGRVLLALRGGRFRIVFRGLRFGLSARGEIHFG